MRASKRGGAQSAEKCAARSARAGRGGKMKVTITLDWTQWQVIMFAGRSYLTHHHCVCTELRLAVPPWELPCFHCQIAAALEECPSSPPEATERDRSEAE